MIENFKQFISQLEPIVKKLKQSSTTHEKKKIIDEHVGEKEIFSEKFLNTQEKQYLYKCLQLIRQDTHLFKDYESVPDYERKLQNLFEQLQKIEHFYEPIGGIAGYHLTFLKLIVQKNHPPSHSEYEKPEGTDLTKENTEVSKAVRSGIEMLDKIGEIYPVAGAGDRLNLKHEETDEPLPAALLNFLGFTLIEGLLRDLQAREFLHYKLTGNQAKTPVVLMSSHEKNNDQHIKRILKENSWFNKAPELFYHILQPLVPVINVDGLWAIREPLTITLKPGGHGIIWRLAEIEGAFDWLSKNNRQKTLIRQINNPIAGIDNGLLALAGIGCEHDKAFGFATCFRLLGAAEGIDVLIERSTSEGFEYCITNIEYTEFERFGIKDHPCETNHRFSLFPSNTNILFADISVIKKILKEHSFPGLIVNLKTHAECLDMNHNLTKMAVGRVESTMQNIADFIVTKSKTKLSDDEKKKKLRTFVTFNNREKTISTTKKLANEDKIVETPDGAFYDLQCNAYKLFKDYCQFELPEVVHNKVFLEQPPFIITYHPGLGPLYSVIKQKIHRGKLVKGSELKLEISELYLNNLTLDGSLIIHALNPLGHINKNNELIYSNSMGKCHLKNVTVKNLGIDFFAPNNFWKADIIRKEVLCIQLEGNAEFFAENVIFEGSFQISVPDGHKMTAEMKDQKIHFSLTQIHQPSWSWSYSFDESHSIHLTRM